MSILAPPTPPHSDRGSQQPSSDRLPQDTKVWTTLVTNSKYLPGVLTLEYSLRRVNSQYPLLVLYTDTFEPEGHAELDSRGICKKHIKYLLPTAHKDYSNDTRFYDCWSKLQPFSLTEFERVCQLDSDMVVLQNMDELMELPLNVETAPFAASHACVCNPFNKPHYPKNWVPENCAYTHYKPENLNDWSGPPAISGLGMCNGGLQVVLPSAVNFAKIVAALESGSTADYDFADQSLLSDVFGGSWVPLSYKYNALKTLKSIHTNVWDDSEVKNIHYILNPKPWDVEPDAEDSTGTFAAWHKINAERLAAEKLAAEKLA